MKKHFNRLLALGFLAFIFLIFLITMRQNLPWLAWRFLKGYTTRLPENANVFDNLRARVSALQDGINARIYLKDEMRHVNADFQDAIGRNALEIGDKMVIQLSTGGWYDLFPEEASMEKADIIISLSKQLKEEKGIPTAFIYCHGGFYEEGLIDPVYAEMDTANSFADEFLKKMEEAGIVVIDSRDVYKASSLTPETALLKSDLHWAHIMALETTKNASIVLENELNLSLESEKLDPALFTDELHESVFRGEYAIRLGKKLVPSDDIHILYPSYETSILYHAEKSGKTVDRAGTFEEAVIERDKLEPGEDGLTNEIAYYIYGDYLARTETQNLLSDNDTTLLIIKDSFGTPVAGFFALAAKNVYAVDLRSTDLTVEALTELYQPDCVVFAYSQQMMRNMKYAIEG